MKIFEAVSFGAIAISLHIIAISFFLPETLGFKQNGEDGEKEIITLSPLSFSASDLIKSWETPPETISEVSALLDGNQFQNMKLPLTKGVLDAKIEIGHFSKIKLVKNNQIVESPRIPTAFSTTAYSLVSIDKLSFQNSDNSSLDLPDKIDENLIKENFSNSKQKPSLEIFKPQIDSSSMTSFARPKKVQGEPKIASLPEKPASDLEKPQNKQPTQRGNQVDVSFKDAKIIKENLYSWGSKIHSAIERKKFYPSGTRAKGRVILNITIHSSGRLVKTEIAKSSGAVLLDNAALTAVKHAQYPVAPEGLIEDQYRFQIPIKMSRD